MADQATTSKDSPPEEEALSSDDFLASLAEGAGYKEPEPDGEGNVDRMASMEHRMNMAELKNDARDAIDDFKTKYPDATDITAQKYVTAVRSGNADAMGEAIETAIRTGMEADTRGADGPKTLRVEEASDDAMGADNVPMNWNDAALQAANVSASDVY